MGRDTGKWNMLDMVASAELINLIRAEYEQSYMSDEQFAELATKRLGKLINKDHINTRRNALGIESYIHRRAEETRKKQAELLQQREEARRLREEQKAAAQKARDETRALYTHPSVLSRIKALEEQMAAVTASLADHASVINQLK